MESEVVDHRADGAAGRILFAQDDEDPGKLHHLKFLVVDGRAAELAPEALLGVDIFHVQVNVSNGVAGRVGRGELRRERGDGNDGESDEAFDTHRNPLYQAAGKKQRGWAVFQQ